MSHTQSLQSLENVGGGLLVACATVAFMKSSLWSMVMFQWRWN